MEPKRAPRSRRRTDGSSLWPLGAWRLFFAVGYQRPRSWMERRQLRFRAFFFVVVGALLVLGVQAGLRGFGLCPK